jgi:hypothetical protein
MSLPAACDLSNYSAVRSYAQSLVREPRSGASLPPDGPRVSTNTARRATNKTFAFPAHLTMSAFQLRYLQGMTR